jgi:hypothetical protein
MVYRQKLQEVKKITQKYMGICINYELLQREKDIQKTLDETEKFSKTIKNMIEKKLEIPVKIKRVDRYCLLLKVGGCETLSFHFVKTEDLEDWRKEYMVLLKEAETKNEELKKYAERMKESNVVIKVLENELYLCRSFCKTQYGKSVEHKIISDILKFVSQQCYGVIVNDESGYYYSKNINDIYESKKENKKIIDYLVKKIKK